MDHQNGFTLIELMIVVVIIGILAAIGYPSYISYVTKSNRSAAESFIMSLANKQEQYMLDKRQYATLAELGYADPQDFPLDGSRQHYRVTIVPVSGPPPTYTITATPTGTQLANDTTCGSVRIDQAGTKYETGTGTVADCW